MNKRWNGIVEIPPQKTPGENHDHIRIECLLFKAAYRMYLNAQNIFNLYFVLMKITIS